MKMCRANVMAVFNSYNLPSRPSRIDFEPEDIERLASPDPLDEDLGGLVQNLHELSTYFQDDEVDLKGATLPVMPSHQLEARVAAILAKSTENMADLPQTPFVDVFRVDGIASFAPNDSDDDSVFSSDSEAFVFDSPSALRQMQGGNGSRLQ